MTFGGQSNEEESLKILNTYFQHDKEGFDLDTAFVYQSGKTEEILGKILTEQHRSSLYIATKVNPNPGGLTYENIRKQLGTSLDRLKLPSVDLLYLHAPDHNNPILESLRACNDLHKEGKFKELGLSNYPAWQVADIWHICNNNGWVKPTVYQGMYNVLTRNIEKELFPAIRKFGIRFYGYNPVAGGLLSGKYQYTSLPEDGRFAGKEWQASIYKERYWKDSYFTAMEHITTAITNYNQRTGGTLTLIQVAFSWLLYHSQLKGTLGDGIILGVSKIEHLETNLSLCKDVTLPEEILKACEEAWSICGKDCPSYSR